jgi:hypothetical protein
VASVVKIFREEFVRAATCCGSLGCTEGLYIEASAYSAIGTCFGASLGCNIDMSRDVSTYNYIGPYCVDLLGRSMDIYIQASI